MRLLQRLGPNGGFVRHLDEIAGVGKGFVLCPGFYHYLEAFDEFLAGVVEGYAEAGHFVGLVAAADAADKAAVNQVVEDGDFLSQAEGIPDGDDEDAGGDFEPLGALADVEGLQQGGRGVAVVGEVVFGDEAVVEAHFLGVLDLLDALFEEGFPVAEVGIRPFVKEAKLHKRGCSFGARLAGE